MNNITEKIRQYTSEAIGLRRDLHRHPELAMRETRTTQLIREQLQAYGIPLIPDLDLPSGTAALLEGGKPGKTLLLRADIDALPVKEASGLPFASQEVGVCHSCGHDIHITALLLCARVLSELRDSLCGRVIFLFQPGEETGAGARMMVEYGALENPKVDAAFGMHVQSVDETGKVGYSTGVNSASLDTFILKIKGKGGHSSQPQLCVDPLMIMNQVYQAVNLLVTRETDPAAMVALTCGVAKGGTAVNIIPEEAQLHIGVRTLNMEAAEHLKKRIPEVIDHYVKAWRGEYEITVFHTPCTYSDRNLCEELVPAIAQIVGEEQIHEIPPMSGTEDFGYFTQQVPGMFAFIGAGKPGNAPLHNAHMILDESVLNLGAAVYANAAMSWLMRHKGEGERENE